MAHWCKITISIIILSFSVLSLGASHECRNGGVLHHKFWKAKNSIDRFCLGKKVNKKTHLLDQLKKKSEELDDADKEVQDAIDRGDEKVSEGKAKGSAEAGNSAEESWAKGFKIKDEACAPAEEIYEAIKKKCPQFGKGFNSFDRAREAAKKDFENMRGRYEDFKKRSEGAVTSTEDDGRGDSEKDSNPFNNRKFEQFQGDVDEKTQEDIAARELNPGENEPMGKLEESDVPPPVRKPNPHEDMPLPVKKSAQDLADWEAAKQAQEEKQQVRTDAIKHMQGYGEDVHGATSLQDGQDHMSNAELEKIREQNAGYEKAGPRKEIQHDLGLERHQVFRDDATTRDFYNGKVLKDDIALPKELDESNSYSGVRSTYTPGKGDISMEGGKLSSTGTVLNDEQGAFLLSQRQMREMGLSRGDVVAWQEVPTNSNPNPPVKVMRVSDHGYFPGRTLDVPADKNNGVRDIRWVPVYRSGCTQQYYHGRYSKNCSSGRKRQAFASDLKAADGASSAETQLIAEGFSPGNDVNMFAYNDAVQDLSREDICGVDNSVRQLASAESFVFQDTGNSLNEKVDQMLQDKGYPPGELGIKMFCNKN